MKDVLHILMCYNCINLNLSPRYLRRSLQELRLQFAGAVPLSKQEKFSKNMIQLQQDKSKLEAELRDTRQHREEVEDRVASLQLKETSLQELIGTLKVNGGESSF